ncbi:MAG: DUF3153 domain-containing protein [Saccharopolyspora sp.]|uniref:DUF3153 domain-containing protein n=1 Tax=Saccharopolyspora TaxID=1835 RepID=UPI00190951EA|nr:MULTISPECIES: DUF3153 domain-containing protein [unclassified Saccharopolyspora]MBK0868522.1 DUF3153 domain-containing protein [Saccharopolyspora sp. HNM0986]MBQ6642958.1 DUF3153 domain-containing protein [Saccharopolyspora sp.]
MKPCHGSRAALAALIALVAALLGGCLHADTSISLSEDDTASGELLLTTETADGKVPFDLRPPEHMADRVQVAPYNEGNRVGSRLTFKDLDFDELQELSNALSPSESRYRLHLERTGSLVELSGSLDLTPLADTDSSVRIELTAPGEVTTTNGRESSGVVTWSPEPGEVTQLNATFQYAGSGAGAWTVWALVMGALALGAVLVITRLAQREHEHETAGTSA